MQVHRSGRRNEDDCPENAENADSITAAGNSDDAARQILGVANWMSSNRAVALADAELRI
jgi:hypothetical protein